MMGNQSTKNKSSDFISDCCTAALDYAELGWSVFPAPSNGSKKSYKSAAYSNGANWGKTTDTQEILTDFRRWPNANVGIATGPQSGIFVVDIDTKEGHGIDGKSEFAQLEAQYETVRPTRMAQSPTGSIHLYFQYPSNIVIRNSTSKIAEGVDVRGEGGIVIAPPSVRPGKGIYEWLNDYPVAEAPNWLIELCTAGDNKKGQPGEPTAEIEEIAEALRVIPNNDENWDEWNHIGMATFAASARSEAGFDVFAQWSRISAKYDAAETRKRWENYHAHPPKSIGFGTLHHKAGEAHPGWIAAWDKRLEKMVQDEQNIINFDAWIMENYGNEGDVAPPCIPTKPELKQDKPASNPVEPLPKKPLPAATQKIEPLIKSSAEFVEGFVPPEYLINDLLQRRYIYSLTAPTGAGKTCVAMRIAAHCALGLPLDGRDVVKVRCLFFAGENPDDVRMRWIKLCEDLGEKPEDVGICFLPGTPPILDSEIRQRINDEANALGPFGLVIIDTSAAYFQGDDENSNTQLGRYARMLREFVGLPGGPTVIVTCHPTKNANPNSLLPRGGGAFVAEMDGNLVLTGNTARTTVKLHWQEKFRGPDFDPLYFKLTPGTTEKLKDSNGRLISTISAKPIGEKAAAAMESASHSRNLELLTAIQNMPRFSLSEMAKNLGWKYKNGLPNKTLVDRKLKSLISEKLVEKKGGAYTITKKGVKAVDDGHDVLPL